MDTRYIGPFKSENISTGRETEVELRVERSESFLDVGVYRYSDGEGIRLLFLSKTEAVLLRDALDEYIREA